VADGGAEGAAGADVGGGAVVVAHGDRPAAAAAHAQGVEVGQAGSGETDSGGGLSHEGISFRGEGAGKDSGEDAARPRSPRSQAGPRKNYAGPKRSVRVYSLMNRTTTVSAP
jgi:hypothetical protein